MEVKHRSNNPSLDGQDATTNQFRHKRLKTATNGDFAVMSDSPEVQKGRLSENLMLFCFIISALLFAYEAATNSGRISTPLLELLAAFLGGLYAGRFISIGKIAIASFVIFLLSLFLDPVVFGLFGWRVVGRYSFFYVNMAVAYFVLLGATLSRLHTQRMTRHAK
jgi:hypothetical protein